MMMSSFSVTGKRQSPFPFSTHHNLIQLLKKRMPGKTKSRFQRSLYDPDEFTLTFELVPSRGGRSREHSRILCLAKEAAKDGRVQAVSITENAGGHPALSPEVLGIEIQAMGLDVISHFSCKDKNRNQMESLLFAWDRQRLHNLLIIAGDYPKKGYLGFPKPGFDVDTVHVLDMLSRMNRGDFGENLHESSNPIQATSFFKGVAISPFKRTEPELMMQYYKLHRKTAAGADYAITQVGFDARKFHELLLYMRRHNLHIPVLGNVFIPNLGVAEFMYRGEVPGCVIPEALYEKIRQEARSEDKGKIARLMRGAKLLAVLKGLGYNGAHIGGPGLTFDDLNFLMNQAEMLAADWRDIIPDLAFWPEKSCHYFEKDTKSGLNLETPGRKAPRRLSAYPMYSTMHVLHETAFSEKGPLFKPLKTMFLGVAKTPLSGPLASVEHIIKFLLFGCRNCGECTLDKLAFLCPQADCAKYLLNGPCGGSLDGWCEVYPGKKKCFYVRIYERLKCHRLQATMATGFIPPRDWSCYNTSSWVNFFQRHTRTAKKEDGNGA
jgi:methylenetetrahydrofolate reductase (NADPH)